MLWIVSFVLLFVYNVSSYLVLDSPNSAIDQNLLEEVLDPVLCQQQIQYIVQDSLLLLQFLDAGYRTPKGILVGNTADLGNYHQCLEIKRELKEINIEGKYCMIRLPLRQDISIPGVPALSQHFYNETLKEIIQFVELKSRLQCSSDKNEISRVPPTSPLAWTVLRVGICLPKPCTTEQAIRSFNVSYLIDYEDVFCRLPNDKPWVPGDYIAVVIFSVIGLLTVSSTLYDIIYTFILKKDSKVANKYLKIFSLYQNGRRLMNFSSSSDSIECLDGIRTLAMLWVIVGHTFITEKYMSNSIDVMQWYTSLKALWITAAPITVDTFFALAGILLVYTTVGKLTSMNLLKNLHLFYLNRLLRMFPVLVTVILLQISVFNRVVDGPDWTLVAEQTERCRAYWWTTLLHVQNFVNPKTMCIAHSWYIAIDIQLHIVAPLVLFWVLSDRKLTAWTALIVGLLASLAAATTYNVIMQFPPSSVSIASTPGSADYMIKYYFNTLTRASPFFVGMLFGYVLHIYRKNEVHIQMVLVYLLWACSIALTTLIIYAIYPTQQANWDNQTINDIMNSFMRPAWALALGWIIFACAHGYGGPVNWFLSLQIWKLPSRISYALYLVHYPLMFVVNNTATTPVRFTVSGFVFKFLSHFLLSFILSFAITLLVDAPSSTIIKILLGNYKKKPISAIANGKNELSDDKKRDNEKEQHIGNHRPTSDENSNTADDKFMNGHGINQSDTELARRNENERIDASNSNVTDNDKINITNHNEQEIQTVPEKEIK